MTEKNYPEEIYTTRDGGTLTQKQRKYEGGRGRRRAYDLGYQAGLTAADYLVGWSNLTEAIQAGERIDWERLDGLEAKCFHPELGTMFYKLERNSHYLARTVLGLRLDDAPVYWKDVLLEAWCGDDGWSLYIKGDIPLRARTADQLEPGTCFKGKCMGEVRDCLIYQEAPAYYEVDDEEAGPVAELKAVGVNLYPRESPEGASASPVNWLASQVEVLDVYGVGTFKNPGEDA